MKKRALSLLLAVAMLCTMLPQITLPATAVTASGTCGSDATWQISGDTLMISGTGPIADYGYYSHVWSDYCHGITAVVIGEGITRIGNFAFYYFNNMQSITIPDTVTSIGHQAFNHCESLQSLTIPDSVTSIEGSAFADCYGLLRITLPEGLVSIGDYAFYNCPSLQRITIPAGVTYLSSGLFDSCKGLKNVTLPDTLTGIGSGTFADCTALQSLTLPEGLERIADSAFLRCSQLQSMVIPDGVTSVGASLFEGCTGLQDVKLPENLLTVSARMFFACGKLQGVTIPDNVIGVGEHAFAGCSSLMSVAIPEGVLSISDSAFVSCAALKEVYYAGTAEQWADISIGSSNEFLLNAQISFGGVKFTGIEVTAPTKTEYLTGESLDLTGMMVLAIYSDGSTKEVTDGYTVSGYDNTVTGTQTVTVRYNGASATFAVDVALGGTCGSQVGWRLSADGVLTISGTGAMTNYTKTQQPWYDYCGSITEVILQEGVTTVGNYAFYGCENLEKVTLPESLTGIGSHVFYQCADLRSIQLPQKVTTIGAYAFYGCSRLQSIQIPATVKTVESNVFYGCAGLTQASIPQSVTKINYSAFDGCTALSDIYYDGYRMQWDQITIGSGNNPLYKATLHPQKGIAYGTCGSSLKWTLDNAGVLTITGTGAMNSYSSSGTYAPWYDYRASIISADIKEGVTSIGNYAFNGCTAMQSVSVPHSMSDIDTNAFYKCSMLSAIYYNGSSQEWANIGYTTASDSRLRYALGIGNCGNYVGWVAYSDGSLKIYGDGAMGNPSSASQSWEDIYESITSVTIEEGVTTIAEYAFYNYSTPYVIKSIRIPQSVTSIGANAFGKCSKLKNVYYNGTAAQWKKVTVSYGNEYLTSATLHTAAVTKLAVTAPEKTRYWVGEPLDTTAMQVLVTYENGSTETVTEGYTLTGYDANTAGEQTVTVTYAGVTASFTVEVREISLTGITVTAPTKAEYEKGENLDLTGMVVTASYSNGTAQTVAEGYTVTGYDPQTVGAQTVTVTYDAYSATFTVTVKEVVVLTGISVTAPTKVTYEKGEELDLTGMKVTASYSDGTAQTVAEGYTVTGYDPETVGAQTVTVTYDAYSATFTVTVKEVVVLTGISVTAPTKVTYEKGEALDLAGMKVTASYSDGTAQTVAQGYTVTGYDPETVGTQTVTVTYDAYSATFTVTVKEVVVLTGISVTAPTKVTYEKGEELDLTGMKVTASYSNGTAQTVAQGYTVTGYDPQTVGAQTVTVTYDGFSATFTVTVKDVIVLTGITVTAPTKVTYEKGEALDFAGMVVTASYSDGTAQTVADGYTVTGYDPETVGTQTVTVTYDTFSATFAVTVKEQTVDAQTAQVAVGTGWGIKGKTVDVPLILKNNPGIATMKLKVHYDSSVLTLTEVVDGGILGQTIHKPELVSPYTLCWANDLATENFTEDGVLVTLRFAVAEDAPEGVYPVTVSYDKANSDIMNKDLEKLTIAMVAGSVEVTDVLLGDVNGDAMVNTLDRVLLSRYLAGWEDFQQIDLRAADVNMDGEVNVRDRTILARHVSDWEDYAALPYVG